jgi:GntR family transcriptional repressor for pyruvate dehydrogenase complex
MVEKKGLESIVEEIHRLIIEEGLTTGDKLPSERFLKEELNVSRQSVREALRALEFLGIIYVRRGEGTYLANMDNHQLFQLIAKYLIQTDEQREDLVEMKSMMETYVKKQSSSDITVMEYDNSIMKKIYAILDKYTEKL